MNQASSLIVPRAEATVEETSTGELTLRAAKTMQKTADTKEHNSPSIREVKHYYIPLSSKQSYNISRQCQ